MKIFSLVVFLGLFLAFHQACAPVLAQRTDESAWLEYRQELHSERRPASVGHRSSKATKEDPAVTALYEQLDKIPLRTFLLSCAQNDAFQNCFHSRRNLAFDEAFRETQKKVPLLSDSIYKREYHLFTSENSFEQVYAEVQSFHQRLLSGIDLKAAERAVELNQNCSKAVGDDSEIREFKYFNGGVGEIPKSQFVCINEQWEKTLHQVLQENSERLGLVIVSHEARDWIKRFQLEPVFAQETRQFFSKLEGDEKKRWEQHLDELKKNLPWEKSLTEFVRDSVKRHRENYPHLTLEPLFTELYQKHHSVE